MDKGYVTLQGLKKQELQKRFTNERRALLRELEKRSVIHRRRKLKSYDLLLRAAKLHMVDHLSFRRLSYQMAVLYGIEMSDTAWKKQLLKFAPAFLEASQAILSRRLGRPQAAQTIVMDATHFSMEGGSHPPYRVHTSMFLSPRSIDQFILTDHHAAESAKHFQLRLGCCYLADRAYGVASQMAYMLEKGMDFIFRVSTSRVQLFSDPACRNRLDCQPLLSGGSFSIRCFFHYRHKTYPIRLVGAILPEDKREAAQKRVKRKEQKKQHTTRPETLKLANWMLLATSLPQAGSRIYQAYRQRWQIELLFKTAKTLLNFHKLRRCSQPWASAQIMLWMAFVLTLSSLHLKVGSLFLPRPSFFFSFDSLLALFP